MKRLVLIAMVAAAIAVARPAQAALAYSWHICQGVTCLDVAGSALPMTSVGDYEIAAIGSAVNAQPTSSSSDSTVGVRRLGSTSAASLDVWFTVTGYTLPTGPGYLFDVALGVSQSAEAGDPLRHLVSYQAWFSSTNSVGFPPGGSSASLLASCTPPATGTSDSCNSNPGGIVVGPGSSLFSIVSLTRFFIPIDHDVPTHTTGTTGTASLTAIPEPGSIVLFGTGLIGLAATIRRRYAKK